MTIHKLSAATPDVVAYIAARFFGFPCALVWQRGTGGRTELVLRDRADCRRLYIDVPEDVQNNPANEWNIHLIAA